MINSFCEHFIERLLGRAVFLSKFSLELEIETPSIMTDHEKWITELGPYSLRCPRIKSRSFFLRSHEIEEKLQCLPISCNRSNQSTFLST